MLFKIDWTTNICIFPELAIFPIDDGSELLLHFDAVFNTVYSGSGCHDLRGQFGEKGGNLGETFMTSPILTNLLNKPKKYKNKCMH